MCNCQPSTIPFLGGLAPMRGTEPHHRGTAPNHRGGSAYNELLPSKDAEAPKPANPIQSANGRKQHNWLLIGFLTAVGLLVFAK